MSVTTTPTTFDYSQIAMADAVNPVVQKLAGLAGTSNRMSVGDVLLEILKEMSAMQTERAA